MKILVLAAVATLSVCASAQAPADSSATKKNPLSLNLPSWASLISGTIRAKAEYQTEEGEARFEVRNARVAFDGNVHDFVLYKAEIDLSDEGNIKMLDAYAGLQATSSLLIRLGQMRVPFSIDAHRSPQHQYFANRSFIAKQVGDVRDVGLTLGYDFKKFPLILEAGVYNGSGLTNQKNYWTKSFNFSAKAQYLFPFGLTLQASVQKIHPTGGSVYLYDGGATLHLKRWTLEAEYLHKHYTHHDVPEVKDVNAIDAFVCYTLPMRHLFHHANFLVRYDQMDDHSDGQLYDGHLKINDYARKRLTGGITFAFTKKINADIRLNYEKYFYSDRSLAKASERDKAVVEFMVHF